MPIWLRNFTINQIIEYRKEEKNQRDNASKDNNSTSAKIDDPVPDHMKKIFQQGKQPTKYTTQRSKK
tara:strand:- start:8433 stop:8633 length:201 start_codon:yes stop_codon:yes gene_type:complete